MSVGNTDVFSRTRSGLFYPMAGHSHATNDQHDLATPSSVLLVPPAFSPYLDTNGGIDLLEIGSLECLTLQLPQTNQMWKGESTEV